MAASRVIAAISGSLTLELTLRCPPSPVVLVLILLSAGSRGLRWRPVPAVLAVGARRGGFALAGRVVRLDVAGWLGDPVPGQQAAALGADRLSGLFLALTFGAAVPVSVAFARGSSSVRRTR